MPYKAKRACAKSGCTNLTDKGNYCEAHTVEKKPFDAGLHQTGNTKRMDSKRWQDYRSWFLRHHPVCCVCGRAATILDHIKDHQGDFGLFWDKSNHQPMCHACHVRKTASEASKRRQKA